MTVIIWVEIFGDGLATELVAWICPGALHRGKAGVAQILKTTQISEEFTE